VPFTFLSHQAPAVALKIARPRWFDGTALVLGSMTPDFTYAFAGSRFWLNGHTPVGLVVFCLPVTVAMSCVVRARVAAVAFAQLPDTPLRLHDYRVLASRRPAISITVMSAFVGAASHALWDTFTHDGRWGYQHVAILRHDVATVADRSYSVAQVLQYSSHVLGAEVTLALLYLIAERRLLRSWYGARFDQLQPVTLTLERRLAFWSVAAAGGIVGMAWALHGEGGFATKVIQASLGLAAGVTIASFADARAHALTRRVSDA